MRKRKSLIQQGTSQQEIDVYNLIKRLLPNKLVLKNDRNILKGKELDIVVPSLKLAIEFNGLFFHCDAKKSDPMYHLHKSIECERQGYRLIQIMSDEWEKKKPLCIDLIKKAIGSFEHLQADKCEIRELNEREGKVFFDNNHLLGNDKKSTLYIGLLYENNILFACSFKKGQNNWVLTRFTDRKGYKVINGLDTCIKFFLKDHKRPLTAAIDRRLYSGNELKSIGFKEVQPSNPNITLTKDFKKRIPIDNLKRYKESDLSKAGYYKVFDCGERRFVLG